MSLYNKGALTADKKPSIVSKLTTLNPNATEFVPSALRASPGSPGAADSSSRFASGSNKALGKTVLDRTESSVSNNSDDEAHQYWRCQLPDDITPDFKVMEKDETLEVNGLPFSNLSIIDGVEMSRFPASHGSALMLKEQQELSPHQIDGGNFSQKMGYSVAPYVEDPIPSSYLNAHAEPWDKHISSTGNLLNGMGDATAFNGNSDMLNEQQLLESTDMYHLEFLASQFPGFAAESLAEVYYANGGDLNLTIEMLTQLELQVEGGINQSHSSKALSAPNLTALDFPALSAGDGQNGIRKYHEDELQPNGSPYRPSEKDNLLLFRSGSSIPSRGAIDFASAVRKMASQDSGIWKYDGNGATDVSVGSSRASHSSSGSYLGGQGRGIYGDRVQGRSPARAAPAWLETGEAVANMYSESREEARDYARLRNVYFEQARQAYLVGNKALAKELSVKGQLHNMQMKAAHAKAQESIYRQRNSHYSGMQGNGRGQERLIDLHGLHVNEAIHVLKRDLTMLRSAARSADQRLQVYICVGTGHHTRGSRTPARLPTAVQRYLLEEEGLDFSEPQPGLLRVVIY
ncbi:hypothetical protein DCAR_0104716 [Daucus carota subsp. sativus]|uniref:Uncharacterized protein n=1 Tax=Daucus carota subsp. sativus TaxID=79200 RepID=A0A166J1N2_DAUCS|nr:PREDICTED: polyadenylate-binding protein-interacting protein 7-like [Daucus carota subsp. sativus]XP_017228309.1 PREDICTED: polyadenylate-binding protein-interacting protein 7-like [Daucus carota subsp. sativus]WOG85526.1 hypothetical protein DCAR_0104716 [Daucus carota subsp. sativus]